MFYDPLKNDHGLPHDPWKALVSPRPIGWISSIDEAGRVNLAPYSFFNAVSSRPNIVAFSSTGWKDSAANIAATGEFVCSLATWDLREAMHRTSEEVEPHVNEMELAGLKPARSRMVRPPRVAESPAALECRHLNTMEIRDLDGRKTDHWLVLGQVVGIFIDDSVICDGKVDSERMKPIARLGYMDYAVVERVFALGRIPS